MYCKNRFSFATAKNGKSLLWEVTGKGLNKPSYFLGTMHLMCYDDAALSANVKSLIRSTGQTYLEIDMDNASELLSGMLELAQVENPSLVEVLNAEDYNMVKSFFEQYLPEASFSVIEKQPPMMISASLFEVLLSCERKTGTETNIIEEAYKAKKETRGLETVEFQSSIFEKIPYKEQANELVKTFRDIEKQRHLFHAMIEAYKQQDIEKLYALSVSEDSAMNQYMDLLLFSRNRNWVKQFPVIAANTSTLFAVGAGHLGGEEGVLNLLKSQGYTIRPIVN